MKTVLLIRHAKSSWADAGMDDFDRPLNERGKTDAPAMAQRLVKRNIIIDAFISSTAKRARKTCLYFMEAYQRNKEDMIAMQQLYLAPPEIFYECIAELDNEFSNIALFGHNNGITEFANSLTDARIENMPTCSIFAVKANCKSWKEFKNAKKEFWFFDYPKNA
ncbi:MAG: histidine phosphatase family protein [Chitinophagaceae bacterium]|nr:histidine phosphatase family protein [Chitinophagaceae bacterium]